jgi:rare lipoprotein A
MQRLTEWILSVSVAAFGLSMAVSAAAADGDFARGIASWYGEAHRGKTMANGQKFNPEQLTAASWFYPIGARVRVTTESGPERSVVVTVTDRGPARRLLREHRIIDLSRAAFVRLAAAERGLVPVTVRSAQ